MNAELLYTSAPQGLKQGSRGFCTVLSTQGMPINLASKLESLSGYRHVYPSGTPEDFQNPVAYSHLKFSVGGRVVSVLSRVAAYGLDYSQRTNKIAHHVVLGDPMPPSGPAALLLEPGFMRDSWDGKCQTVAGPLIPGINVPPNRCQKWELLTGDAGWGGRIAEAWLDRKGKPTFVIFSIEQSGLLLGLIAESISLLPPSKRWQATFGTYITNLPPDVDCKVRCVIAGSDEARMASARGEVIDLSRPNSLGVLPPSEGARAAREGIFIGGAVKETSHAITPELPGTDCPKEIEIESAFSVDDQKSGFDFDPNNPFGERHPPRLGSLTSTVVGVPPAHPSRMKRKDTRRQNRLMIGGAIALCFLIVSGGVGVFLMNPPPMVQLADESTSDVQEEYRKAEPQDIQKPPPPEPNLTGTTKPEPKDPLEEQGEAGGESTSGTSNASTNIGIETSDFEIELGKFVLPNEQEQGPPISLNIGIPNATLTAKLNLHKIEGKLGKDSEVYSNLKERLKMEGVVKWDWQEFDGTNWRPLNMADAAQDLPLLSSTLRINHNCKPESLIRVVANFELPTDPPKHIAAISRETRSLDKLHLIQINTNKILSTKPEDFILNIKPGKEFPENHKLEWCTDSFWVSKVTLRELRDNRVSTSDEAKKQINQLLAAAQAARDHIKEINSHRSRLNDFFTDGFEQLKLSFQSKEVPSEIILAIRGTLREKKEFKELNVLSPWNPSNLTVAIEEIDSKKMTPMVGQKSESQELIKDFYEKMFKETGSPSGYKPANVIENYLVTQGLPVVYEWHWVKQNWNNPFKNKSTPASDYQNLLRNYLDLQKALGDIETEFDLDRMDCFRLSIQNDESGFKAPVKSIACGLWVKVQVVNPERSNNRGVNNAKKDEPKSDSPGNLNAAPGPLQ